MNKILKHILGSLAVVAVVAATGINLYHSPLDRGQFSAAAFETIDLTDLESVSISPSGQIWAGPGGEVTINTVFLHMSTGVTEVVSGDDLANSPIQFVGDLLSGASTPGISANVLTMPNDFQSPHSIVVEGVLIPNSPSLDDTYGLVTTLTINASDAAACSDVQLSLILPQGGGLEFDDPADLPTPADTGVNSFNFGGVTPIASFSFHYLHPAVTPVSDTPQGARAFDISVEVVEDLPVAAQIESNNGAGFIQASVREEADPADTADNVAELFNTVLGLDSPLAAYRGTGATVHFVTRELGVHTNDYYCILNEEQHPPADGLCFSDGSAGSGGLDVLNLPLTLNNTLREGQTALVHLLNGTNPYIWSTSNDGVVEISSFAEAEEGTESINFDSALLTVDPDFDTSSPSITVSDCTFYPSMGGGNPVDSANCYVEVENLAVSYDISAENYTGEVILGSNIIEIGDLTGSQLVGTVSGSGSWIQASGMTLELTGQVSGNVSGVASGIATGTVSGQIYSDITVSAALPSLLPLGVYVSEDVIQSRIETFLEPADFSETALTAVGGSFVADLDLSEGASTSPFILAYPKDDGNSIISVTDGGACVAAVNIDVAAMEVHLEMEGGNESIDVGDTKVIHAYPAWTDGYVDTTNDLAGEPGLVWLSSNPAVATVDADGLVTAVAPGTTSITASWDTGIAEIGTVYSDSLVVNVSKIEGLTILPDETCQDEMSAASLNSAKKLVNIAIHSPDAAGSTLEVEGETLVLTYDAADPTLLSDLEKVADLAQNLSTQMTALQNAAGDPILSVNASLQYPGVLVVQPINQDNDAEGGTPALNQNAMVDIEFLGSSQNLSVIPHFTSLFDLLPTQECPLQVIAEYDNGTTKRLSPAQVSWVSLPTGFLSEGLLATGVIAMGETPGTTSVTAQFANADGSTVYSNALTVVVNDGPIVEFMNRIGSGNILKGMTIQLHTKLSHVLGVNALSEVEVHVVKSNFNTAAAITADANAVWYGVQTLLEQDLTEVETGPEVTIEEGEEEVTVEVTETATPNPLFRIYDFPVNIPVSANLFDGTYKLLFYFFDSQNNTTTHVHSVYVGEIQPGDVNGDGKITMMDVILAFRIFSGAIDPTASQLDAADYNNNGTVNILDVILIFQAYVAGNS